MPGEEGSFGLPAGTPGNPAACPGQCWEQRDPQPESLASQPGSLRGYVQVYGVRGRVGNSPREGGSLAARSKRRLDSARFHFRFSPEEARE